MDHNYLIDDSTILKNERKTLLVIGINFITMIVELLYGYHSGSMALLADGWHMAAHVGALGITALAYKMGRSQKINQMYTFGAGKIIPLGGYTSALLLIVAGLFMGIESVHRWLEPQKIAYTQAMVVASVGLIVNVASALIFSDFHMHFGNNDCDHSHDHQHSHDDDQNFKGAYLHIITDALTSVFAIIALFIGKQFGIFWTDPLMGVIGSVVIIKWGVSFLKETGNELLDIHAKSICRDRFKEILRAHVEEVVDVHVWKIAPKVIAGELVLMTKVLRGADFYREIINNEFEIHHLVIEERLAKSQD